jgi:nucleoside-diphosphate-sugar epimerase
MKILVTGGAGYIGSTLVPKLLECGHEVTVVDNFMYGQSAALAAWCYHHRIDIIRGDARDPRVMVNLVKKHDAITPLAAIVGAPACDNDVVAAESINRDAIKLIVELVSSEQVIVVPISNSGYGIGSHKECTEKSPLRPVSLYGKLKVEAEQVLASSKKSWVSLRLATVFGMSPRMRRDLLVNDFVWKAVTDRAITLFEPHFRRNYIHVRDVAGAFVHVLREPMRGIYNVGLSDANLTKLDLCKKIKEHIPDFVFWESPIGEDPDKRDYIVSNAKIEKTGFRPNYSLDDGIKELVKGYRMMRREYSNV